MIHGSNILVQTATICAAVLTHYPTTQWAAKQLGYFRLVLVCITLYGLFVTNTKILTAFGTIDRTRFSLVRIKRIENIGLLVFLVLNLPNFVIRVTNVLTNDSLPEWTNVVGHHSIFIGFFLFTVYDNAQAILLFLVILKRTKRSRTNSRIKRQMKLNVSICALDWVFVILTIIITFGDFPYWRILQHITMAGIGIHVYLLVNVYQGLSAVFEERSINGGLKLDCHHDTQSIEQTKELDGSPTTEND
jgi:FtsH-binding integral membrane protein